MMMLMFHPAVGTVRKREYELILFELCVSLAIHSERMMVQR